MSLRGWLRDALDAPGAAQNLPTLNADGAVDALPDGSLVRFVGMVQDVHDPEYYDGVYEEVNTATGAVRDRG